MNNNTVYDVDFTRALPDALKEDETMLALGKAIAGKLQENIRLSKLNIIYARIDELPEYVLDILAYDLHVDWYDPDATIEVKRTIIKESVRVHKRLGTKYAVESVVQTYFGSGEVRQWYEYGGEPHHFKIISGNPNITNEDATEFFAVLNTVKRLSSWLETVLITLTGESSAYFGVVMRDFNREAYFMGPWDDVGQYLTMNIGEVLTERTAEAHIMGRQDAISKAHVAILRDTTTDKNVFGSKNAAVYLGVMLHEKSNEQHTMKEE